MAAATTAPRLTTSPTRTTATSRLRMCHPASSVHTIAVPVCGPSTSSDVIEGARGADREGGGRPSHSSRSGVRAHDPDLLGPLGVRTVRGASAPLLEEVFPQVRWGVWSPLTSTRLASDLRFLRIVRASAHTGEKPWRTSSTGRAATSSVEGSSARGSEPLRCGIYPRSLSRGSYVPLDGTVGAVKGPRRVRRLGATWVGRKSSSGSPTRSRPPFR